MQLYFNPMDRPVGPPSFRDVDTAFNRGFSNSLANNSDSRARYFMERGAIGLNYDDVRGGPTTNVHPRRTIGSEEEDPTLNAVLLGSWPSKLGGIVCARV